jgi:hypothetical protein
MVGDRCSAGRRGPPSWGARAGVGAAYGGRAAPVPRAQELSFLSGAASLGGAPAGPAPGPAACRTPAGAGRGAARGAVGRRADRWCGRVWYEGWPIALHGRGRAVLSAGRPPGCGGRGAGCAGGGPTVRGRGARYVAWGPTSARGGRRRGRAPSGARRSESETGAWHYYKGRACRAASEQTGRARRRLPRRHWGRGGGGAPRAFSDGGGRSGRYEGARARA